MGRGRPPSYAGRGIQPPRPLPPSPSPGSTRGRECWGARGVCLLKGGDARVPTGAELFLRALPEPPAVSPPLSSKAFWVGKPTFGLGRVGRSSSPSRCLRDGAAGMVPGQREVTAGEKAPKHPIPSPPKKPAGETEGGGDRPRAAVGGTWARTRSFPRVFCVGDPRQAGVLPAAGHGGGGVAAAPRLRLRAVKGTRGRRAAGGRRGAIFGKEFGNPSSKSVRKVPARWATLPRGLPLPLSPLSR